ncbi:MAG: hypothetical protein COA58_05220 [Bacteroidetes bacterium]|nr:MAG: hypothetical protein COA58_05220 [Bacteroidota bacterium]
MKNQILTITALCITSFFIYSCSSTDKTTKEDLSEEQPISNLSDPPVYDTNLLADQLYAILYQDSLTTKTLPKRPANLGLDDLTNSILTYGTPIYLEQATALKLLFNTHYLPHNPTISNIDNDMLLSHFLLAVDYDNIKNKLDEGFACYPILYNTKFSYILVKAKKDVSGNIIPIPTVGQSLIQYYELSPSGYTTFDDANPSEFQDKLDYYATNVNLISYLRDPIVYNIKSDKLRHPGACFFSGKRLAQLFSDNSAINLSSPGNAKLRFEDAAVHHFIHPTIKSKPFMIQSTLVSLIDNTGTHLLTNTYQGDGTFKEKAMDFGYLCPPECP